MLLVPIALVIQSKISFGLNSYFQIINISDNGTNTVIQYRRTSDTDPLAGQEIGRGFYFSSPNSTSTNLTNLEGWNDNGGCAPAPYLSVPTSTITKVYDNATYFPGGTTQIRFSFWTNSIGCSAGSPDTFEFADTQTYSSNSFNFIDFSWPQNNTSTPDFRNWVLDLNLSTTTEGAIGVLYGDSTSTIDMFSDFSALQSIPAGRTWAVVPKSHLLNPMENFATSSVWFAYAALLDANGDSIATTSVIFFNINPNYSIDISTMPTSTAHGITLARPYGNVFNFTATEVSPYFTCSVAVNDWTGCLGNVFLALFRMTFVPSDTSLSFINSQILALENVFPFNLYFGLIGDVRTYADENNVATSTPMTIKLRNFQNTGYITVFNATSSFWVNIATTAHCDATCAQATVDRVFNVVKMFIWLSTAITILAIVV